MEKPGHSFFKTLVLFTVLSMPAVSASQERPNIVLILMDNFGWGEPGFNGGGIVRGVETKRLDILASEGLRLTNFNVEAQCTPSRSAIMTGRYAIRSGNSSVPVGGGVYGLVQWEVTMAEMLSDAGYATGIFGKWHLGHTEGRFPTDQGFDEWYGIPNSTDESVYFGQTGFADSGVAEAHVLQSERGEMPVRVRPYRLEYRQEIDGDLTDKAIDFMKRKAADDRPFFLYVPYTATHYPSRPHPDFAGLTGNGHWADLLLQVDTYVGRLLDAIDDLGVADETIVVFTADNGPEAIEYGSENLTVDVPVQGSPGPWRGTLFTGFEGSLRVPFVARWPGRIAAGGSSDEIVHAMDLFPTFASIAGGRVPDDRVVDGMDMTAFLTGQNDVSGREGFVVYMGKEVYGVKWRNWKVHLKEQETAFSQSISYDLPRIYNLLTDPQERNNVLFPATWVAKASLKQLTEHMGSLRANPPIPPGTPDPYTPE